MPKRNGQGIELLADPTRRAIVVAIAVCPGGPFLGLEPSKIAKEVGRSRPATSRQLRILRKAGLISVRKNFLDGRRVMYFMDQRKLGQITAWLAGTEVGRTFPPTPRDELVDPSDGVV
jgi:DNA-binding transcriptional ArsR family regulator